MLMTAIPTADAEAPDLLATVLTALEAKGWIPDDPPASASHRPAYFHRDNLCELYLVQSRRGWVANVAFSNVPAGHPDVIGTAEAHPFTSPTDAFLAGARIICEIVTGSPELPFHIFGDKLICVAY